MDLRPAAAVLAGVLALAWLPGCGSGAHSQVVVIGSARSSCETEEAKRVFETPPPPAARGGRPAGIARLPLFASSARLGTRGYAHELSQELGRRYELAAYYPATLRRLPGGSVYAVVAVARPGLLPSAACARQQKIDRAEALRRNARIADQPVYCFLERRPPRVADGEPGCGSFAEVAAARRVFAASFVFHQPVVDLVPMGVAAVRVLFPEHAPVVARVRDGSFVLPTPAGPPPKLRGTFARLLPLLSQGSKRVMERRGREWNSAVAASRPLRVEWLSRRGATLRTISPPASAPEDVVASAPISG